MRSEEFSLARIEGLRRDGVSIALDDFGTGYSNLAQLMSLPMDRLKLDRSLLDHIDTDRRQQVVVASMVSMASELGFEVLAEGVETAAQFELIKATGCAYVQGYLVARPMPECQMLATLGADETFPLCSPDLGGFADVHVA
jgi:EAL domain-containing protein (putative c-di-GMP-specific phosphodiesterase class I)